MKVIIVVGAMSSGKTTSIKLACKELGLDFTGSAVADIQCVSRFRHGRTNRLIGIGSAGDDVRAIRANLNFFKDHELDYAICACSAPTLGMKLLEAFVSFREAEPVKIESRKVDQASMDSENGRLATAIVEAVRG